MSPMDEPIVLDAHEDPRTWSATKKCKCDWGRAGRQAGRQAGKKN